MLRRCSLDVVKLCRQDVIRRCVSSIADVTSWKGKRVLVRTDFNVPMKDGTITDDSRIRAATPTLEFLLRREARVVVVTHVGRPKGENVPSMSVRPIGERLSNILREVDGLEDVRVDVADECVGPEVRAAADRMENGGLLLLENVRFHKEETSNDERFAQMIVDSTGADAFVNDAFGTAHRAHASTEGVTRHVSGPCVAGFLMERELDFFTKIMKDPERPLVAITGGAKVSTKLPVLSSLLDRVDRLLLGGGMIFTFMKAMGRNVGDSILEEDMVDMAKKLMQDAERSGVDVVLPEDIVIADRFADDAATEVVSFDEDIPDGWIGMDIGPQSVETFEGIVRSSRTIVWNGPMGVFEMPRFAKGTLGVARAVADASVTDGAISVIGGGDSVAAVEQTGLSEKISHVSTGGGASLELLEGKVLPGVSALTGVQ